MRRVVGLAVWVTAVSCAPPSEGDVGVGTQASALLLTHQPTEPEAHLGTSLVGGLTARRELYAGAPGMSLVQLHDAGWLPLGEADAGDGTLLGLSSLGVISGGPRGLKIFRGTSWSPFSTEAITAIAMSDPLVAVANDVSEVMVYEVGAGTVDGPGQRIPTFKRVTAMAWIGSTQLVIGMPSINTVELYDYDIVGRVLTKNPTVFVPGFGASNFGRAIVVGNVSPTPGMEVIVASQNAVWVYSASDGRSLTWTIDPTSDYSSSLTLQPNAIMAGNAWLDGVWAGDSTNSVVTQIFATTTRRFTIAAQGEGAGAALAIAKDVLAIGAPDSGAGHEGTVYLLPVTTYDAGLEAFFEACDDNSSCTPGTVCTYRLLCAPPSSGPTDAGSSDAGPTRDGGGVTPPNADGGRGTTTDGGTTDGGGLSADAGADGGFDAGLAADGGTTDAGSADAGPRRDGGEPPSDAGTLDGGSASDAGLRDAGSTSDDGGVSTQTLYFGTLGCSVGSEGTWLTLALALFSWRRSVRRRR